MDMHGGGAKTCVLQHGARPVGDRVDGEDDGADGIDPPEELIPKNSGGQPDHVGHHVEVMILSMQALTF